MFQRRWPAWQFAAIDGNEFIGVSSPAIASFAESQKEK
jgi:hypothetical protein